MKSAALILPILLPTASAWTLIWRNSDGEEHTERGRGPSDCIVIDHAQGQLFELDGQGEQNINMLLFSNDECSGDPAGRATESFRKESSVDLLGFQVVALNSDDSTSTSTGNSTTTATASSTGSLGLNGTLTSQPTGSSTDLTVTLPTVSETETETETTPTNTDAEPTATETTEPSTTEGGSEAETPEPTPTDGETPEDAAPYPLSRNNLVGVAIAAVAGYAVNWLF
ncbi:hypothetical protein BJX63DRAFT_436134 [Aspergillus granulosus]|uniref:Uncharacterized protein n=1 Tax=Aspergillus granulosus TaxID=176169 RepID=A0ABR4GZ77_9EURO